MLTDVELLEQVFLEPLSPHVAELARRFAADVAGEDAEAAAFERPQPVSLETSPRPVG
jgi:hypothetical protein